MTTPITLSLPSDQPRPLRRAAATLVTVRSGTVWLTEPDALDDRFLAAGDSHRITSHALVLIEAQHGVAEVVLQQPRRRSPLGALAAALRWLGLPLAGFGGLGRRSARPGTALGA